MRADASRLGVTSSCGRSAHLAMKHTHRLQLGGALGATLDVPFQLVTRVIGQFVIKIKRDIFLYPIAIHNCLLHFDFRSARAVLNFCVARNSVFFAVSSVVFRASPMVRSFSPW